jgi:hypothetical protein
MAKSKTKINGAMRGMKRKKQLGMNSGKLRRIFQENWGAKKRG